MDGTLFVREIKEQPAALRAAAEYYGTAAGRALLRQVADLCRSKRKIIFTGMGSSLYAPYGIVEKELGGLLVETEIRDAGELLHFGLSAIRGDEALIAVSQSGESAETKKVVELLKGKAPVIAIVNNAASSMGRTADYVLPIHAGQETSVSTKTFTNTQAVLLLLSTCWRGQDPRADVQDLLLAADLMERNLPAADEQAAQAVRHCGWLVYLQMVARGSDMVVANQWALTVKEGARLFSEALTAGLFRHGPIEIVGPGHAIAFIFTRENEPRLTANLAREIAVKGSAVIALCDEGQYHTDGLLRVTVPCPRPRYFPILCAPFCELFIHHTAKERGFEAGVFRHAAKVTDRE